VFCGGLDITEFYNPNPDRLAKYLTNLQDTWLSLYMTSFPTVSVINVNKIQVYSFGNLYLQTKFELRGRHTHICCPVLHTYNIANFRLAESMLRY